MPHEFRVRRIVEFADTDAAGIMHFANYFRIMEATEHAFFRSLGLSVHSQHGPEMAGWVRVSAACDYRRPLRYQDEVDLHLRITGKTNKSMTYTIDFLRRGAAPDEALCARGTMTVVYVTQKAGQDRPRAAPMPDDVNRLLQIAPDADSTRTRPHA